VTALGSAGHRSDLDEPLRRLLGDKTAVTLAKALDLHTVGDLLRHYPRRYAERGKLTDIAALREGEYVTVLAEVRKVNGRSIPKPGRKPLQLLEVTVGDGHKTLKLTYFNQQWRQKDLRVSRVGLFAGKVERFRSDLQLTNPEYQLMDGEDADALAWAGNLVPVYPAADKMPTWTIGRCVRVVLDTLGDVDDPLPFELRTTYGLFDLASAFHALHRPASFADVEAARERLRWEEAFLLQVALAQRRRAARAQPTPPRPRRPDGLAAEFDAMLPFTLTAGQQEVAAAIDADLAATQPMHRLLQGEVGSGKTVVALRAMLTVVDNGGQAALLAPTEVLAQQHARNLRDLLGPIGRAGELDAAEQATRVVLLTGSTSAAARREARAAMASGDAGIVVGTHALLEPDIEFHDLALVVVDEQHRFGVHQRDTLRSKGIHPPHVLVMTATPIPRTVAMTVYGDLETSTLAELPKGRAPIATHVVPPEAPHYLERAWTKVREDVAAGHQAFVVCPRIGGDAADDDEAEQDDLEIPLRRPMRAAVEVYDELTAGPLAGLRVELLHGRMPSDVKDNLMREFAAGRIDVLVATTVVEVGVDVQNATVMVVVDADRFGVSQLHQLRGRVGRGAAAATCLLVTDMPVGTEARERVDAVAATLDGFELSRVDLRQRREGDILGTAQSGTRSRVRLLSLLEHEDLIRRAREEATSLIERDPELASCPPLAAAVQAQLDEERARYLEKG
jgi:ATP-dependent DNA helicase RecG